VVVEEVDCECLVKESPYSITQRIWVSGKLLYIEDRSKPEFRDSSDNILNVLLTERGTFVAAVREDYRFDPDEVKSNFNHGPSNPFGGRTYQVYLSLGKVLELLETLTSEALQSRVDEYERREKEYQDRQVKQEQKYKVDQQVRYNLNYTTLKGFGLTEEQIGKVLEWYGVVAP
jgi:hypothetical protein